MKDFEQIGGNGLYVENTDPVDLESVINEVKSASDFESSDEMTADEIIAEVTRQAASEASGTDELFSSVGANVEDILEGTEPVSMDDAASEPAEATVDADGTMMFIPASVAAAAADMAAPAPKPETKAEIEEGEETEEVHKKGKVGLIIGISVTALILAAALVFLWVPAVRGTIADAMYKAERYDMALTLYRSIDDYENAALCQEAINLAAYQNALALYDEGKYEEAKAAFVALGSYRDCEDWAITCDGGEALAQKNKDYRAALDLMSQGNYQAAGAAFTALDGHRDSAERAAACDAMTRELTVELLKNEEVLATLTLDKATIAAAYDEEHWCITMDEAAVSAALQPFCSSVEREVQDPLWSWAVPEKVAQVSENAEDNAEPVYVYPDAFLTIKNGSLGVFANPETVMTAVRDAVTNDNFETVKVECEVTEWNPLDTTGILELVNVDAVNAEYDPETHGPTRSESGWFIDEETIRAALEEAPEGEEVQLQVEEIVPEVTTEYLNSVYYSCVIGDYTTGNLGTSNRVNNITLACNSLNGIYLGPGERLSYNQALGERTYARGYREAGAYRAGVSVQEIGGGICQVSSTLYNAVLEANLKINSRECHVYPSTYCPMGLDATVSWGGPEFIFTNNTDYPILISAKVESGKCKIVLYGTDDGVTVKMETQTLETYPYETTTTNDPEKEVKTGHTGYYVVSYRCVYDDATGKLISRTLEAYSRYSRQDIVIYQPDPDPEEPGKTDPGTTDPGTTDPGTTDPGTGGSGTTDPGTTDPGTGGSGSGDSGSGDSGSGDSGSTDSGSGSGSGDSGSGGSGTTDSGSGSGTGDSSSGGSDSGTEVPQGDPT